VTRKDDDRPDAEAKRESLRRKRAISVVPEAGDDDSGDTAEARKRLFTEPGEAKAAPAEGVVVKRRWFSRGDAAAGDAASADDEPVVDVEEERVAAARSAAEALRESLKSEGKARRSAAERARAIEAEARAQGRRSPDVARARKAPAPEDEEAKPAEPAGKRTRAATLSPRRRRGTTEMLPPPAWQRHDALVVAVGLMLLVGGAFLHRRLAAPPLAREDQRGLTVGHPAAWLTPARVGRPLTGLAVGGGRGGGPSHHVVYQSPVSPRSRVEILVGERPASGNLRSALALARVARHGEAHWADESDDRTIAGRDWVRTPFRYTFRAGERDEPSIARAIEYATFNGRLMYVVTIHGDEASAAELEALVVPTLAVDPNHPAALGEPK
jgi:hypothetical protein